MSYAQYEMKVIQKAEKLGIIKDGNVAISSMEESAVGRCVVELIIFCAVADIDLVNCLAKAYEEMRDE